jgi:hypothetical protein
MYQDEQARLENQNISEKRAWLCLYVFSIIMMKASVRGSVQRQEFVRMGICHHYLYQKRHSADSTAKTYLGNFD